MGQCRAPLLPLLLLGLLGVSHANSCSNTCGTASDGVCNDGGPGSTTSTCDCATDCDDCGVREVCLSPISTAFSSVVLAKYSGAAKIGSNVYFAPSNQDNVGILSLATSTFSSIDLQGSGVTTNKKFDGAVKVGSSHAVFAPHDSPAIGIVDHTDQSEPADHLGAHHRRQRAVLDR